MTGNCIICHTAGGVASFLELTPGVSHANLVGVVSVQADPPMNVVTPGDPSESYLWYKLNDTQRGVGGFGVQMPVGGMLDADSLALIRQWITEGATDR